MLPFSEIFAFKLIPYLAKNLTESSMSGPKRQHYVPKMILEGFTDRNGRLHSFNKKHPKARIVHTKPENLLLQKRIYTQTGDRNEKNCDVEKFLASLESDTAPIIQKIICAARAGKYPELTLPERKTWDKFVFSQALRVPDVLDSSFQKMFDESVSERDKKNVKARGVLAVWETEAGLNVLKTLGDKKLAIAVITSPKKSLIIGSNPVLKIGYPLEDSRSEYWLPISHDVAVVHCLSRELFILNDEQIRSLNETMFKESSIIAGYSRRLIASLSWPWCKVRKINILKPQT